MKQEKSIGIAGCGIGGLALGAILAANGWRVQIFDQFDAPGPVGSGLVVQPVGQQVLACLSVLEAVLAKGAKLSHMYGEESLSRRPALDVSYGAGFGLGIHRASLFNALLAKARATGCEIIPATTITGHNGACFLGESGRAFGPFDLCVDASGARSRLSPLKSRPLAYGALWATVDWPDQTALPATRLTQCYSKAARMAGVLPIGTLPNDPAPKAAIFWSLKVADFPSWQAQPIETWQAEARALWPEFAPFVSQIQRHSDMTLASYTHGTLAQKTGASIAYIGDAAHCASPQLGQGANMALLDAFALGLALQALPVPQALQHYNRTRRAHVFTYQLMSRLLTPLYQSDSRILPWLRNHLLAPLSPRWPFAPLLTKVGCGDFIRPIAGVDLATLSPPARPPRSLSTSGSPRP